MVKVIKNIAPYSLLVAIGLSLFPSAGRDDVHITYWEAYSLAHFGKLLNYNGDQIEQSSSLLHTLLLAFIHYFSNVDLPTLGPLVSIFFGLVTVLLTGRLSRQFNQEKFLPQLIVATSVPVLYWSFGALETSMVSAAVLFVIITVLQFTLKQNRKNYFLSLAAIAVYLLLRPEAFFVMGLFLFMMLGISYFAKEKFRPYVVLLSSTVVLFIGITSLRYVYFGSIFPQPVTAKVGASILHKVPSGGRYYIKALRHYPFFIFLAVPILLVISKFKQNTWDKSLFVTVSLILSYSLFVLMAGGDWMEGARFFAPVTGPAVVIATPFYLSLIGKRKTILYGLSLNILFLLYFTSRFSTSYPLVYYKNYTDDLLDANQFSVFEVTNRVHYRDIPLITSFEAILDAVTAVNIQPTIMSKQAGMVPFYLFKNYYGQAKFIDFRGLSTHDFTQCQLTKSASKNRFGIALSYNYFFENINTLQQECQISKPDIIYDLDNEKLDTVQLVESAGYTVIYLQTGKINRNYFLKGDKVEGIEFIAVKNEIVDEANLEVAPTFQFD